ncbi:hypothetical protein DL546_005971 [Coniochaeta pulveracea]|uniref:Uncharacterized protein n=1 Tax=Coniochaeta pulveracea TaxID=177199 RepID=A0A420YGG3_9PEZI|nr:hypothetical protein DL546_005971 [Coniochaeta pulveracea]
MASAQVNGEVPHSAFIDHLLHYPAVNDGVKTVRSYLETPYQYVSPYVKKADDLGDKTLSKVEERFPIVKKQTGEIYEDGRNLVLLPYRTANAAKDHVLETYNGEVKKVGGDNLLTYGKALITTSLVVTGEVFQTVSGFLSYKKEQTKGVMDDATAKWQTTANDLAGKAGRFAEVANNKAQTKLDQVSSGADSLARKIGHNAEGTADYAMDKADDVSVRVDRATAQARTQANNKAADAARTVANAAASVSTGADRVAEKADKKATDRK